LLPLVHDVKKTYSPGWCSYTQDFDSPETEVFCGGLNSKTPTAAAVWRQGNLLHFGFEPAPAALNAAGQALLVNAVVYISRFTEDRPIPRTPSPFEGTPAVTRARLDRVLRLSKPNPEYLAYTFTDAARKAGGAGDWAAFQKWYGQNRPFLRAEPQTGKLTLDEEAKRFGVTPSTPEFFTRALAALRAGGDAAGQAGRLLARYAPEGPADTGADYWQAWWEANEPYLFFSDSGGYRWYVDPLARKRRLPTAELRGPERATPP
jgi:hypothetical protein